MKPEDNDKINEIIEEMGELFEGNSLPIVMTALIRTISSILVTQIPTEEMSMDVFSTMVRGISDSAASMIKDGQSSWEVNKLH
jgi:hypothetical protein